MKPWLAISLTLIGLRCGGVLAYEQPTHRTITKAAVAASFLGNDVDPLAKEKRLRLGLPASAQGHGKFRNSKGIFDRTEEELIADGAEYEDDGIRALNHFTDPRTMTGLDIVGASSSIDWALGTYGTFHVPPQSRSYHDLKRYYFQAVMGTTLTERRNALALTLETLGHIAHHIQDAAQPQHTRNDVHLYSPEMSDICRRVTIAEPEMSAICLAYSLVQNPSFYEQWTLSREKVYRRDLPLDGYAPVYAMPSGYAAWPGTPRRLFADEGLGIAEYSNRNFLTSGTLGQSPPGLGSPYDVTVGALCSGAVPPCGKLDPALNVRFWPSNIEDRLRPSVHPHPYAASSSILAPDFSTYAVSGVRSPMTVNRFTFEYHHAYLLPRAVGYTAGFINFFFRGDLDIQAADDGVFAAVDLSCGSVCGFNRLKLRVKNATLGEAIGKGELYLVARFRTNDCFVNDLSGEDGGSEFHSEACRSVTPKFLVSKAIPVEALPNGEYLAVIFSFDAQSRIPINASDLSFQIVYRGQLGMEPDAIVVSTVDVSEPNYVAIGNLTDYVFYTGDDRYSPLKAGDSKVLLNKVTFSFQDPASGAPPLATVTDLTGGEHAQFAFITTKGTRSYWLRTESTVPFPYTDNAPFRVEEFFKDDDIAGSVYSRTCQLTKERGRYRQYSLYYAQTTHGRVSEAAPGGVQPAALRRLDDRQAAKYAADCKGSVPPGTYGMFDLSYLTPYTNANAKPWTINFP